jgi:TrpR-related protein YerC/YecD
MSKIIPHTISKIERNKLKDLLYAKIAKLGNKKEVENFFEDILTESEVLMLVRRLEITKMLLDGQTYFQIRKELGVGYDTIKTVSLKLSAGSGGFIRFIKQIKV